MKKSKSEKARTKKEALKLLDKGELGIGKIAEITGFSRKTLYNWTREKINREIGEGGMGATSKIEIREEAFKLFDDGLSGLEVSRRLGIHRNTAYIWRGINKRNKNKINPSNFDDNDVIDMLREGFNEYEISRKTGIYPEKIIKIKLDAEQDNMI